MLKKLLFAIALTTYGAISAQTVLIDPNGDGGFEDGATFAANGWTPSLAFDANWNQWATNTAATGYTGARAAYITNLATGTPPPYAYSDGTFSFLAPKFYRDVTFDPSESHISLSFDWKEEGGTLLKVWLKDDATDAGNPASALTASATNILLGTYTGATSWTNETITIPSSYADNVTRFLIFEWTNDGSAPTAPPAAIDNISLVTNCLPSGSWTTRWIQNFTTAVPGSPFNITDTNPAWVAPGYENNSATDFVEQFPGGEVDFTVIFGGGGYNGFNIWVDWDGDGDFLSSPNEKVFATGILTPSFVSGFQIPSTIPPGTYTMRIRSDFNNADPAPCGYIQYGESKDYSLIVSDINCLDNPSNIAISAIDYTTATVTWDPASPAPANGYEYFITQNPNPIIYNQTPTGTSATTSVNLTGLSADTTYYVWVRSVCGSAWGQQGEWQGSATFNTLVNPPTTTNVSICPGDPSDVLTADAACVSNAIIGHTIISSLDPTDPTANRLNWFTTSGTPCGSAFSSTSQHYDTFEFQVDAAGVYVFETDDGATAFDPMGYITSGAFTFGSCVTGTYIAGDDDSSPIGVDSRITATLSTGITYTLVTTRATGNTTSPTPYQWNITGPGNLTDPYSVPSGIEWYTSASGGTPIFTGVDFDPVAEGEITGTTPGVYSYWAACSSSPDVRTRADFNVGKAWTGDVDSNWNTPGNWSPSGAPTDSVCVIITAAGFSPIIDGITAGEGYRLIIENGATLTQQPNSILTITDAINVKAGGTYTMLDSASLFQDTDVANTVNGTFTMQRTTTISEDDYVYWSSPVNSFNVEDISINTPNGYKFIWEPTATRPVGPPPDSDPRDFGEWQSADTGAMDVGKGYIVKGPTGHGSTDAPFTATFSGTPNNGTIIQPITRGTYQGVGYTYNPYSNDILTITSDDDNWNLIGNPYPSALSIEDFLTGNSTIDGNVYLWTHGTDIGVGNTDSFYDDFTYNYNTADYIAINSVGVSSPVVIDHKFIGAGQGFFVLMNDTGTTTESVTFENYMRHTASYRNDQFYRSADTDAAEEDLATKHRIWLDYISPSGSTNTTLIGYANGATNDRDRMYDAKTTRGEGLNFYSMIEEDAYLIQGRQTPFVDADTVPLGLNITEAGIQTIAINTVDGLFLDTDQDIYIKDLLTGTTHNISNAPYTFTSETGIINDRLVLTYRANNLSVDDFESVNDVKVYKDNTNIVVNAANETMQSIEVYDMLGRTLFKNTAINQTQFTINALQPSTTTLFLKVKLTNGEQRIAKIIF
ncbi:T9SS sorting signal type C domain-containing protein [Winogradskyella psychrotolerans]|uniref:GEVED domain-containing protein n=1 Tax=Winogradskyella psychrotolerans TaxID=1344585 RepID=UPI001C0717E4|nr:GEVED domain-containing protein [Winogradskyella psychrotolerans]MBU2922871.1 T9SS sorting signal type C domain-containing protein [Winogradskyella psychrotolerans]